jgi:hypothetical protein
VAYGEGNYGEGEYGIGGIPGTLAVVLPTFTVSFVGAGPGVLDGTIKRPKVSFTTVYTPPPITGTMGASAPKVRVHFLGKRVGDVLPPNDIGVLEILETSPVSAQPPDSAVFTLELLAGMVALSEFEVWDGTAPVEVEVTSEVEETSVAWSMYDFEEVGL